MVTRVAVLAAAFIAALAPSALAADYDSELVASSPATTLESGETLGGQFVELRNTGTETWTDVMLSGAPMSRATAAGVTAPGDVGRFDFSVTAPSVTEATTVHGEFAPSSDIGSWTGAAVPIDYTILPKQDPQVLSQRYDYSPDHQFTTMTLVVTDNVAMGQVDLRYGTETATNVQPGADGMTYSATFHTGPGCIGSGYAVHDRAGNGYSRYATPSCTAQLPSAHVRGTLKSKFTAGRKGTLIRSLFVMGGPQPGTIALTCSGKGCPFKQRSVAVSGPITNLRPLLKGKRLRTGAVLEIRISGGYTIASVTRLTFRDRHAPKVAKLCAFTATGTAGACS